MKPTAYLINFARGGFIDEKALFDALKSNKIAGAALDVFNEEPLPGSSLLRSNLPNLHLTPHIAASTKDAQIKAGVMTANGILDALTGKKPKFCVNTEIYDY